MSDYSDQFFPGRRRALASLAAAATGLAQEPPRIAIPNLWDPRIRLDRPEPGPPRVVRFLADDDYPPFHFAGPDGTLTGFSVELARAVCEKLAWTCTIQPRRFDTLADSLSEGRGDVLAAAMNLTPALRARRAEGLGRHDDLLEILLTPDAGGRPGSATGRRGIP